MLRPKNKANSPRQAASFLVRVWQEVSEGGEPVLRTFMRDLGSGKERYVRDPTELGAEIIRRFRFREGSDLSSDEGEGAGVEVGSGK